MNLTYQNKTLYIDLVGEVNITEVTKKVTSISDTYKINNLVVNTDEAFITDYKKAKLKKIMLYSRKLDKNPFISRNPNT